MGKQRLAGAPLDETDGPMAAREEGKITQAIRKATKLGRNHVDELTHGHDWLPVSGRETVDFFLIVARMRGRVSGRQETACERRGPLSPSPGQLGSRPADRWRARGSRQYMVVHCAPYQRARV